MRNQLMISIAALALTAGPALADCASELSALQSGSAATGSVGSSGSDPSGQPRAEDAVTTANADALVKDGSTMPLASNHGGGDPHRATSHQDAVSQQEGGQTAAARSDAYEEQAGIAGEVRTYEQAIAKARMFQGQGNEAECMAALEHARRLKGSAE
ncbi:hypothetical protein [Chthonobacter rhizosphaerae]|uniref:hypothetical protein n=1 Tax=Chthonobacter rhizosphaerae TaxID=2735553 RepID=UPI0015EF79D3|nr:hypothetical protein [Chthonobacter rhizosphaerae]